MAQESSTSGKTSSFGIGNLVHGEKLCDSVYAFHNLQKQVDIEIVFIHDLVFDGSKEAYWKTWLARDGIQDNCWPKTWLVEEFPHARILSLSYDANAVQTATSGRMGLYNLGESLVQEMTAVGIGQHECPVLFVCHGLGGLVAKQIVVTAYKHIHNDEEVQNLLRNLRAFYFYDTPHGGAKIDLGLWNRLATHGPCMDYLKTFSPDVGRLHFEFENIHREVYNNEWMDFSVIAMHATSHGKVVVPESSARQFGHRFLPLNASHVDICQPQSKIDNSYQFLTIFVSKVIKVHKVQHHPLDLPNGLVGMDDKTKVICEKLGAISILGLVGMGGIGKTTISKFVYNLQAKFYDKACFLQDVRSRDVASIQKELLLNLQGVTLGSTDVVSPNHLQSIKQCIMEKRVLIVIDDVGDSQTLKNLQVPSFQKNLSSGSRVIVTCRNRQVLEKHVSVERLKDVELMEVDFLNDDQAMRLFCYHVFDGIDDEDDERKDFEDLAMTIVKACGGLPLSLEVIGQHLRMQHKHPIERQKEMWEEALRRLCEAKSFDGGDDNEVLWKSLEISYGDLSLDYRSMFLDFACFFCEKSSKDLSEQSIGWIWNSPTGLQNLLARSLIKVNQTDRWGPVFTMHDQLRDMGRGIVTKNVTRLWEATKIGHFFEKNEGLGIIEGISLQNCLELATLQSQANPQLLQEMTIQPFNVLRLLDLTKCRIEVVEFFLKKCSKELSWLCLNGVDNMVLPHTIQAIGFCTRLRVLQMKDCCHMEELPTSIGNLVHLLELDLTRCERLQSLPCEIGRLKQLKRLQLQCCYDLKDIPASVGQLTNLGYLGLNDCEKLVSMVEFDTQMDHLYKLNLSGCNGLQIPFKSLGKLYKLRTLNMFGCIRLVIENPSESFGQLSRLRKLDMRMCSSFISRDHLRNFEAKRLWDLVIESLSSHLEKLYLPAISQVGFPIYSKLKVLHISNYFNLEELPESLGDLIQLEELMVEDSYPGYLKKLPTSMYNLTKLEALKLYNVGALDRLSNKLGHLSSLKTLTIGGMKKLKELPASISQLSQLQYLSLQNCVNLRYLPTSLTSLNQLSRVHLDCCDKLELPCASFRGLFQFKCFYKYKEEKWIEHSYERPFGLSWLYGDSKRPLQVGDGVWKRKQIVTTTTCSSSSSN